MKTLYESLLSNTKGGVEGELREWIESQKQTHERGHYDLKATQKGFDLIFNDFSKIPYQGIFDIQSNLPSNLTGIYYNSGRNKEELNCTRITLNRTTVSEFDASNIELQVNPGMLDSALSIKYSIVKLLKGLPESKYLYTVEVSQSTIHKIEGLDSSTVNLDVTDGVILNYDHINNNKIHRLTINGLGLSQTLAGRMQANKEYNDELVRSGEHLKSFTWRNAGWYICKPYADILDDLLKNNKIDMLAIFSPDDTPIRQTYFINKTKYGYKLVKP